MLLSETYLVTKPRIIDIIKGISLLFDREKSLILAERFRNFFFFHGVFYPFGELSAIII